MTQKELAESLGVSRMPVREALILLEYQGLIHRLPNNHVQVADLTEDYLTHLFSLCAGLEADLLMRQPEIIKNNDVTPQSLLRIQRCRAYFPPYTDLPMPVSASRKKH